MSVASLGLVTTAMTVLTTAPAAAADPDAYEPDDTAASASPFTVGGPAQQHTIAPGADADWVSFAASAGFSYVVETSDGSPAESMDTVLRLYDADGTTLLDEDDDGGTDSYSRIEYPNETSRTIFARVTGYDAETTGAYALAVTATVVPGFLTVPADVDFGDVAVGSSKQVTIPVQNSGSGPVTVGQVSLGQAGGWSVVSDQVSGATIPGGETRDLEVRFAPTSAYQGPPVAVYHEWTNLVARYLYSGGILYGAVTYTGFQNVGGAGVLPWRVNACQPSGPTCTPVFDQTGSAAVVAGGRYHVQTVVSAMSGSGTVSVLAPVTGSVSLSARPTGLSSVTYARVPDAYLTIESDDPESPAEVDLYGVALATASAQVGFSQAARGVEEDAGTVLLTVTRSGRTDVPASVGYARTGGTATAGKDVSLSAGRVEFAAGETTRTIPVTVADDAATEAAETVQVTLSAPSAGAEVVSPASIVLTIRASDQRPDVQISTTAKRRYIGDDIYNSSAKRQSKKLSAARTQTRTFYVRVYNDGNVKDDVVVKGTAARRGSKVTYLAGKRDITKAMRSKSGWRISLAPGAYRLVKVRIKILATATIGSAKPASVTATWTGDGVRLDRAKAVVDVSR